LVQERKTIVAHEAMETFDGIPVLSRSLSWDSTSTCDWGDVVALQEETCSSKSTSADSLPQEIVCSNPAAPSSRCVGADPNGFVKVEEVLKCDYSKSARGQGCNGQESCEGVASAMAADDIISTSGALLDGEQRLRRKQMAWEIPTQMETVANPPVSTDLPKVRQEANKTGNQCVGTTHASGEHAEVAIGTCDVTSTQQAAFPDTWQSCQRKQIAWASPVQVKEEPHRPVCKGPQKSCADNIRASDKLSGNRDTEFAGAVQDAQTPQQLPGTEVVKKQSVLMASAPAPPCVVVNDSMPGQPSSITQPSSMGVAGAQKSQHAKATAMVPMMRARHMDILDQQYLNDAEARPAVVDRGDRRHALCHGTPSVRARSTLSSAGQHGRPESRRFSEAPNRPQSRRPLGPNAVMPVVKGSRRIQEEAARKAAEMRVREAKLKEQFRLRGSSCPAGRKQTQEHRAHPTYPARGSRQEVECVEAQ